jgi:LmbE family N-acetylglucosaminyl deacetylase
MKLQRFFKKADDNAVYESAVRFSRELKPAQRILILAPHPDDETLGCGGSIALHKAAGAEVRVCMLTDGAGVHYTGDEDIRKLRRSEALKAAAVLQIDEMIFLDFSDMALHNNQHECSRQVGLLIRQYCPDLLYAPSPLDFHPDHRAAFRLSLNLLQEGIATAFYEIYAPIRFNTLIDISGVIEQKQKALACYASSLLGNPAYFIRTIKGLNAYRGFLEQPADNETYYEAFLVIDRPWKEREFTEWLTYSL